MENKIVIDLEKFRGKSIIDLKYQIHNHLSKIIVSYAISNPAASDSKMQYHPYADFDFSNDNLNSEIIAEIKLEE